eukprot:CAMPEP_0176134240 /NCGR_PEP_ID=MMETSP0120_2-20121206/68075_1 /TAXON_ID=160619 /ORGANISM="Kryptoperidinium foliaceum, Strain CCMP 1326" /LENGTH=41 /DNA_ID= /DNA_START= /DNA_END= /DNA_ORIENTATION=
MPGKGWKPSCSAPAITPEEEKVEKDNLTPKEIAEVTADLHG